MAVVPLQHRFDGPQGGPVVLLLPPFGAKWSVWEPQIPELTRYCRVLRVNHRGHGATPLGERPPTVDELGADLEALLDEHRIGRVSVVAAGFGGMPGTWLAVHRPERVHRIAYLAGAARVPCPDTLLEIAERARADGMARVRREVLLPWFTPGFARERPDVVQWIAEEFEGLDPAGFASCCEAAAVTDQFPDIARVRAPALVVSGAHDPLLPPGHGRRLAAGIPGARFELLRGAAHLAGVERSDRVNELVMEHLAGVSVGSG
ncbi:alpha/beta fold hydrolase [Nocardiopsis composta]|uniref:3-oxoadipate enol-lactonase n=1 Tax=Nocardiopsis composta TaxID=157465 RepID=A0A7W8QP68_9ACTN|nr:alpha/beta fold hydrolase [Nocardiopsis composta]MBB5433353.1 3-oxoadipate enol-lactonase [Nocardiopsis composta]